jgi:hypothetical protein
VSEREEAAVGLLADLLLPLSALPLLRSRSLSFSSAIAVPLWSRGGAAYLPSQASGPSEPAAVELVEPAVVDVEAAGAAARGPGLHLGLVSSSTWSSTSPATLSSSRLGMAQAVAALREELTLAPGARRRLSLRWLRRAPPPRHDLHARERNRHDHPDHSPRNTGGRRRDPRDQRRGLPLPAPGAKVDEIIGSLSLPVAGDPNGVAGEPRRPGGSTPSVWDSWA